VTLSLESETWEVRREDDGWARVTAWWFKPIQMNSIFIQIVSKFDLPKKDLLELEILEIKYGSEGFEKWNIFLYRNFSRFEMDLK
jgi:hypothetical protein